MNYFYDTQQKCFLVEGIHTIPDNAISVKESEYQHFINGRNKGREIVLMDNSLTLTPVKPSSYHRWNGTAWQIDEQVQAQQKAEMQERMRSLINAKRDETDAGGVWIEQLGKWVDSDAKAYQNVLGVKASLDLLGDMQIPWTWADNSTSNISKAELTLIVGTLLQTKQANHANALKHKTAMMAAENPENYDYSTGWAKTYGEFVAEQSE